jgi:hypothetical protein
MGAYRRAIPEDRLRSEIHTVQAVRSQAQDLADVAHGYCPLGH